MLTNDQIIRTLREIAILTKHEFELEEIHHVEINQRSYQLDELPEFKRDLVEAGNKIRILLMENQQPVESFVNFLTDQNLPVFVFAKQGDELVPSLIIKEKKK